MVIFQHYTNNNTCYAFNLTSGLTSQTFFEILVVVANSRYVCSVVGGNVATTIVVIAATAIFTNNKILKANLLVNIVFVIIVIA